ncbi:MAG: FAD:protein FMN transferase [Sphingobacteriales bacterium]|nr:MAG: FAD:protein FMN transferase [Sphingobacteriales bacterium]
MLRLLLKCVLLVFINCQVIAQPVQKKIQFAGFTQGTTYNISYYASSIFITQQQVDSILSALDRSLSIYNRRSLISTFNCANNSVKLDKHLRNVLKKSLYINKETNGIFDVTIGIVTNAWGFGKEKISVLPDSNSVTQLLKFTGSEKILITQKVVEKKIPCLQLDVNGIAQGYSVDVIADFFEKRGVKNYLIEIGGEIRVNGKKNDGTDFRIAIEVPDTIEFGINNNSVFLHPKRGAVTTSGNYRKYYESNGKKIPHIVDARTGWPASNELISVTVFAKDAITADGYDNAIMVMGLGAGIEFVENHKELAAFFIYKKKDGSIGYFATKQFLKLLTH